MPTERRTLDRTLAPTAEFPVPLQVWSTNNRGIRLKPPKGGEISLGDRCHTKFIDHLLSVEQLISNLDSDAGVAEPLTITEDRCRSSDCFFCGEA